MLTLGSKVSGKLEEAEEEDSQDSMLLLTLGSKVSGKLEEAQEEDSQDSMLQGHILVKLINVAGCTILSTSSS